MMALLGASPGAPNINYNSNGSIVYDPAADLFVLNATPLTFRLNGGPPLRFFSPSTQGMSLDISAHIDGSGLLVGGISGNDFALTGTIVNYDNAGGIVTGLLLTGEVAAFGYLDSGVGGTTDDYDFRLTPIGGQLLPYFAGTDIGVTVGSEGSTFSNSFEVGFHGGAKGNIGPINPIAEARISIAPDGTNEVGQPHSFTVTVSENAGAGFVPAVGESVTVNLTNVNGASATTTNFTGATNAAGQFVITTSSVTAGQIVANATAIIVVGGQSLTRDTDPATSINAGPGGSGPAVKTYVDAQISIEPNDATNEVGQPHTFTVTVLENAGNGGGFVAAAGETVTVVLANANGATTPTTTFTGIADANGQFQVTASSSTAGQFIANAFSTIQVGGLALTRDTDFATLSVGAGPGGSGPALKTFVDARISISPSATNEVGQPHTFVVTVLEDAGNGLGFVPAADESVTVNLNNLNGASAPTTQFTGTTDANGQFVATAISFTAGQIVANATSTIDAGGITLARDTKSTGPNPKPGSSGPATKTFVDARIVLSPLAAENSINDPHIITATVEQNDGLNADQGGDGVTGFGVAPDGTAVTFALTNSAGATAAFIETSTAVVSGGVASVQINSSTGGLVTLNAASTFAVGSVSLTRDTNPNTAAVAGPGGSGPATKFYRAPGIDIEKTTSGPTNANTTLADYDNEDVADGPGVPALTPGSVVTWTYKVTNTGNVPYAKAEVVVTDDNGTPTSADDFSPTFLSDSDVGNDMILSPGENWFYTASGTVQTLNTIGALQTFDFSGSSGLDGSNGNIRTFSAGGVSVRASAFSRDHAGAWATAWLGVYGGGLGVTDNIEGDGSNNTHTVDNVGNDNYVLFEFSEDVVVDWASLGYVVNDSDMTVWIGKKTDPFNNHQTLSDALLASLEFTEENTGGSSIRTANLNAAQKVGNVLVISARTGEISPADRFKIERLRVNQVVAGVYQNRATVSASDVIDSDLSHYKNSQTPPPPAGSISGTKYRDISGNGLNVTAGPHSPADVPLAGTTIYLDSNNNGFKDIGEPATLTEADGEYSFTGLTAGTYYVREVVPTGWLRTSPHLSNGYTVNLASGGSVAGKDFANFETVCADCTIANVSFKIVHVDGTSEVVTDLRGQTREGDVVTATFWVDDTGIVPVTLVTYAAPDPFFDAKTASQQEIYEVSTGSFSGGGPHTLSVSIPNSYYQIDFVCGLAIDHLGPAGSNIFYTPQGRLISADNSGTHARVANAATISGVKYNDLNGNGARDASEAGLKNWVIYIDSNNNGVRDAGERASVTRADGSYTISNLTAGTYTGKVREVMQNGWTATEVPGVISLVGGENETGVDFGNKIAATGSVSGYKFNDRNADGEWDKNGLDNWWGTADDEVPLSGWKIFTDYDDDGEWDSNEPYDYTDSNGYYKITGITAGVHAIDEVMRVGWVRTTDKAVATVPSAGPATNVNFGNFYGSTIMAGDTATVNFWKGSNGQKLIRSLNGGGWHGNSTALGNWLATNFDEMYGYGCGSSNLAGKSNTQVLTYFLSLANNSNKQLEAQIFATVLSVYVTDADWAGGTYARAYGFNVSSAGVKNDYYNIGNSGGAFGVINDSALTVWSLLQRTNDRANNGVLWSGYSSTIKHLAKTVFTSINAEGDAE